MLISNQSYYEEEGALNLYISAASEDIEMAKALAKDIFAGYGGNINIWLGEGKTVGEKEAPECLNKINAAIILISNAFVKTDNYARLVEFPIIESKVPFLPIAVDSDVEKEFNELCGNLQFIDKTILEREAFLDTVFMNLTRIVTESKLRETVRSNFKRKLFISYRRKDRSKVQPLIHAIHKPLDMENVGIWYDSHLTVGEDYDNEIFDELHNADGVILMVTPLVLAPDNFVLKKEIPDALRTGKSIIPVLTEPVDMEEYHRLYPELSAPLTTDLELHQALGLLWAEDLTDHTGLEKYNTAMAYLYGFNGETDSERAVSILGDIAENELEAASHEEMDKGPETAVKAYKKLIEIYEKGIGVKKDPMTAAGWYDKYLNHIIDRYEENPTQENLAKARETSFDMGVFCYENKWYPQALQCLQGALYKLKAGEDNDVEEKDFSLVAKVAYYMGCACTGKKDCQSAIRYLLVSADKYEKLISFSEGAQKKAYEKLYSDVYEALGLAYSSFKEPRALNAAQGAFWKASEYYQALKYQTNEEKKHLAKLYAQMAEAASEEGSDLDDARAIFGNAEEKCTSPDPDAFIKILAAYSDLLEIYEGIIRVELKRYLEKKDSSFLKNFYYYVDKTLRVYENVTYTGEDLKYADMHLGYLEMLFDALKAEEPMNLHLLSELELCKQRIMKIKVKSEVVE